MKKCCTCKSYKPLFHFHNDRTRKDKKAASCKSCAIERSQKRYYEKVRSEESKKRDAIAPLEAKAIDSAKESGHLFYISHRHCKTCGSMPIRLVSTKQCRACVKRAQKEIEKTERGKDLRRARVRKYYNLTMKNDDEKMSAKYARGCLSRVIRQIGGKKSENTFDILGYSPDEFKAHIERQFKKGMTWKNRHKWHIDHIIPVSKMIEAGETDVSVINALTNIRPMWSKDNVSKGNKVESLL